MKRDGRERKSRTAGWVWAAAGCVLAAAALGAAPASAAVLVLDDFKTGPFVFVADGPLPPPVEQAGEMVGGARRVVNPSLRIFPEVSFESRVDTAAGRFAAQWSDSASSVPVRLSYGSEVELTGAEPLDVDWSGFSGLEIVVDEVVGTARLVMRVADTLGRRLEARFDDVMEPGVFELSLPSESEAFDPGSIADLEVLWVGWDATGGVAISELRLVPEPGALGVLALGAAALFRRQRG